MFSSAISGSRSKCYITHGTLPYDIKIDKPGRQKKPFSTILASPWYHNVDLILPTELHAIISAAIERESSVLAYSRVHMKLEEIIDGNFFNVYIKTGTIEMLSEGPPVSETQFSLRQGVLRLDVPKHIFHRLGLDGKPIVSGGRKHMPNRMRVEINLRLPSMVTGRKGFERIRWAFKNVLNESVTWLFRDCSTSNKSTSTQDNVRPIQNFHPLSRNAHPPATVVLPNVLMPDLSSVHIKETSTSPRDSLDILDWLSLITLQSPRIDSVDEIDPFLCRYSLPSTSAEQPISRSITILRWHGFIPASWLSRLTALCASILQPKNEAWFAISAAATRIEHESADGWCFLYPSISVGRSSSASLDKNGDDSKVETQIDSSNVRQTSLDISASTIQSRDFLMWELVDSITNR